MAQYTKRLSLDKDGSAIVKAHLAVVLFGLAGVLGRGIASPAIVVTFGRVLFSSITIALLFAFRGHRISVRSTKDVLLFMLAGVVMAAHWTLFMASIQTSGVAIGTITFATFPLFVTFLEPMFFHERISGKGIIQAVVMIIGVMVLAPIGHVDQQLWLGLVYGMGSSLTYAILSLLNRRFSNYYHSSEVCLFEQGVATVVLLPILWFVRPEFQTSDIPQLIILGVLCTALAHSLFVGTLKQIKVRTASMISGMESIYGILLGCLLLAEFPTLREILGGTIILGVALWASLRSEDK